MGNLTYRELRALIAPLFNDEPENIDNVILITRGVCQDCDDRDNVILMDTFGPEVFGNLPFAATLFAAMTFSETCRICLTRSPTENIDQDRVKSTVCFLAEEPEENIDNVILMVSRVCPACKQRGLINGIDNLPKDQHSYVGLLAQALGARHIPYRIVRNEDT